MTACSEQQRVACGIGGIYTALAIENVLPIMHSGPGCQATTAGILGSTNGNLSGITYRESIIPSTNFCEQDVVFGALDRLRGLVEKCLDYYKSDMFIIVDGCTAEIVGDDIEEVAGDFQDRDIPVLYAKLPGFKGNNVWGHSQILNSIIDQYLKPGDHINKKQVNIFGIVPYYDPLWMATLEELEKLLYTLGLEPNIIYGRGKGIKAINRIPQAEFNMVLSPWTDLDIVEKLKDKFGTPWFHYPCVPIGPEETAQFIRALVEYAHLDREKAEAFIQREESRYFFYIKNALQAFTGGIFSGGSQMSRRFYVNSNAAQALSITRFLVNDWGLIPTKIFITDDVPEIYQKGILEEFKKLKFNGVDDLEVIFTIDGGLCDQEIKKEDFEFKRVYLFGTAWDQLTAKNKQLPFVPISPPYGDTLIMNKTYLAWNGALAFIQDLYNDMLTKILGTGIVAKFEINGH